MICHCHTCGVSIYFQTMLCYKTGNHFRFIHSWSVSKFSYLPNGGNMYEWRLYLVEWSQFDDFKLIFNYIAINFEYNLKLIIFFLFLVIWYDLCSATLIFFSFYLEMDFLLFFNLIYLPWEKLVTYVINVGNLGNLCNRIMNYYFHSRLSGFMHQSLGSSVVM